MINLDYLFINTINIYLKNQKVKLDESHQKVYQVSLIPDLEQDKGKKDARQ